MDARRKLFADTAQHRIPMDRVIIAGLSSIEMHQLTKIQLRDPLKQKSRPTYAGRLLGSVLAR